MAHFLLSAEATFSAAHTLPGVPLCDRMHGHNWRVRVTVRVDATELDQHGMGVDFRRFDIEIRPNPDWEQITIFGSTPDNIIPGNLLTIEVDTISFPEPAALSMLAIGSLAMLRRKRRA